jgi:hypothetical protein
MSDLYLNDGIHLEHNYLVDQGLPEDHSVLEKAKEFLKESAKLRATLSKKTSCKERRKRIIKETPRRGK